MKQQKIEAIKDRISKYIKNLFKQEKDYWKPVTVGNIWSKT